MKPGSPDPLRRLSRHRRLVFAAATIVIPCVASMLLYGTSVFLRSARIYETRRQWTGSPYEADEKFGYIPKPNSRSSHSPRSGEEIPVLFDGDGFRVPLSGRQPAGKHSVDSLFLGDSYTHGYGVPAEETFAHLSAEALGTRSLNAGVSGWGLPQMLLRARRDIPRFRPRYVFVQYSYWLVERSQQIYGPRRRGLVPVPYFYNSGGHMEIQRPVFTPKRFSLPMSEYLGKGVVSFAWEVGLPLFLHDDYHLLTTYVGLKTGRTPRPPQDRRRIVDFFYREIDRLCRSHGAEMFILKLYASPADSKPDSLDGLSIPVIDTLPRLLTQIPEDTHSAWATKYSFLQGDPPVVVDDHPNGNAHRVIAEAIAEAMREP